MSYLIHEEPAEGSWIDSRLVRWFADFDENKLRPFFIRNYNVVSAMMEDEYQDLIKGNFDDTKTEEIIEKVEQVKRTFSAFIEVERTRSTHSGDSLQKG